MEVPVIDQPNLREGTIFEGRFEILSVLGVGGVGEVYKARHVHMNKTVAIKVLRPSLVSDKSDLQRFKQEASTASNLTHPNIVSIYDFGIAADGNAYLVMEYLDGCDLDDLIEQRGHLDLDLFLGVFSQVCDALQHAHKNGVVHRDIKPSNIMLIDSDDGSIGVKIVDFGLAKLTAQEFEQHLTRPGVAMGTPMYMSPEQCRGGPLDHRTDIYSLGCVMYAALTGSVPFLGDSAMNTLSKHLLESPPRFSVTAPQLNLPATLERVILTTLAKDPGARQQSMTELSEQLTSAILQLTGPLPAVAPQAVSLTFKAPTSSVDNVARREPNKIREMARASNEKSTLSFPAVMLCLVLLVTVGVAVVWHSFRHRSPQPTQVSTKYIPEQNQTAIQGRSEGGTAQSSQSIPAGAVKNKVSYAVTFEASQSNTTPPAISKAVLKSKPASTQHPRIKDANGLSAREEVSRAASFEEEARREFYDKDYRAARASYEACLQCQQSLYQKDDPHLFFTLGHILQCMEHDRFESQFASYLDQALAIFNSKRTAVMREVGRSKQETLMWGVFARACDRTAHFCIGPTKNGYLSWAADFYYLFLQSCSDEQKVGAARAYARVLTERGNEAEAKAVRQKYNLPEPQRINTAPDQRFGELMRRHWSLGRGVWQRSGTQ
jgi:serine/threonine protein kinase